MRFLANENIPAASVQLLRQSGHDVLYAVEHLPSLDDAVILHRAHEEQRLLITFDRDYGEVGVQAPVARAGRGFLFAV